MDNVKVVNSKEQSPLTRYKSYAVKHVIVGFKFSEDACTYNITGDKTGITGTVITEEQVKAGGGSCGGSAIVIVNELEDATFVVHEAETTWEFFSSDSPSHGSYLGWIMIRDRVGMLFAHQLRKYCEQLGMGLGHITFAWKTFFVGTEEGSNGDDEKVLVWSGNPMVFHVTEFSQSLSAVIGRAYYMNIASSYNTFGQLPQFAKMYQTTLTHAEGSSADNSGTSTTTNQGLVSRKDEDAQRTPELKEREDRNKPMQTLNDVFASLGTELTNQAIAPQGEVQAFQANVRQDYAKKNAPNEQYIPNLPIKYEMRLDPHYETYKINNRNLIYEQPEQDQRLEGLRSMPFHVGTSMNDAIDTMMMLSADVGKDMGAETATAYRVVTCVLRGCESNYNVVTNIVPYVIPKNRVDGNPDTGPGEGAINGPLDYYFQGASDQDTWDIISINYRSTVAPTQEPLERPAEGAEGEGTGAVAGNREPMSMQRMPRENDEFYSGSYTGNRGPVGIFEVNSLENARDAAIVRANLDTNIRQNTSYLITIRGNPYILNDINRNPIDVRDNIGVSDSNVKGAYILYDKVESVPMYLRLSVFMRPDRDLVNSTEDVEESYFYQGYIHINKIITKFGNSFSEFTQTIQGLRREDSI